MLSEEFLNLRRAMDRSLVHGNWVSWISLVSYLLKISLTFFTLPEDSGFKDRTVITEETFRKVESGNDSVIRILTTSLSFLALQRKVSTHPINVSTNNNIELGSPGIRIESNCQSLSG